MNDTRAMPRAARFTLAALAALLAACAPEEEGLMVGTLERDRHELKAEYDEPITRLAVADGESVAAGDVVAEQDSARFAARLRQQAALRDQAAARLAEARRGPRAEAILEARARVEAAAARRQNADASLERTREMFERKLSNRAELDAAQAEAATARANEEAQREALSSLENGTTAEELAQAEAALEAAEAVLAQARIDLERTRITAPVVGRVDRVHYRLGERPPVGATVATLLADARVYARIYVPEPLRSRLVPGTALDVRIDGEAEPRRGTVRWVSSDASFTPYFALTEYDRSRLAYLAEVDLEDATDLPTGVPLQARLPTRDR